MKRLIMCVVFVISFAFVSATEVMADTKLIEGFEVEPYIKIGTLRGNEDGRGLASGRKSYIGYGVVFTPEQLDWLMENVEESFGFELWAMNEPTDEDRELVSDGLQLYFQAQKAFEEGSPFYYFGKADLISWKRNCCLINPGDYWNDLLFVTTTVGVGFEHKSFYGQIGGILPVHTNVDSGRKPTPKLGFTANLGLQQEHFKIEFYYDRINFSDQNLKLCGARLGFPF